MTGIDWTRLIESCREHIDAQECDMGGQDVRGMTALDWMDVDQIARGVLAAREKLEAAERLADAIEEWQNLSNPLLADEVYHRMRSALAAYRAVGESKK